MRPGRGTVRARFELEDERFEVEVVDERGEVVARVCKTLYVRRRDRGDQPGSTV